MGSVATVSSDQTAAPKPGEATASLRRVMVERQLRPYDVTDLPVLERFLDTPREIFLPAHLAPMAYSDLAISTGPRALLPPLVLARFLQEAAIRPEHKVLDIAGGAGFPAALLSGLAGQVTALESDADLAEAARANLAKFGAANARVVTGPLNLGAPDGAPYDVILIHGAVESGLDRLFEQLAPNGRLVAFNRARPGSGVRAVAFDRSEGKSAGERALFDAHAEPLEAFARAPEFRF